MRGFYLIKTQETSAGALGSIKQRCSYKHESENDPMYEIESFQEMYCRSQDISRSEGQNLRKFHDYPVLGVLNKSPGHGYNIHQELMTRLGDVWNLRLSHIYAVLARLENDRLVWHDEILQSTRPTRKVFHITQEGRNLFLEWVGSPVFHIRLIRLDFLAKLHFSRFDSPSAMSSLIHQQLLVCHSIRKNLERRLRQSRSDVAVSNETYRLTIANATIQWLENVEAGVHYYAPITGFNSSAYSKMSRKTQQMVP